MGDRGLDGAHEDVRVFGVPDRDLADHEGDGPDLHVAVEDGEDLGVPLDLLADELGQGMADRPVAALLQDLKRRGLLETTLVLWVSEFGRTPLGENRVGFKGVTGRDHHPFAFTVWMAGGGVKAGQVLGRTDGEGDAGDVGWGVRFLLMGARALRRMACWLASVQIHITLASMIVTNSWPLHPGPRDAGSSS